LAGDVRHTVRHRSAGKCGGDGERQRLSRCDVGREGKSHRGYSRGSAAVRQVEVVSTPSGAPHVHAVLCFCYKMVVVPKALILRTAGTNCDVETAHAFELAGAIAQRIHLNRVLENPAVLGDFQLLAIPGGFSYGDDISSG